MDSPLSLSIFGILWTTGLTDRYWAFLLVQIYTSALTTDKLAC